MPPVQVPVTSVPVTPDAAQLLPQATSPLSATSEGKIATSAIAVAYGVVVGSEKGTVVAANGAVKLGVPAGAAPAGTVFVVEKMG